MQRILQRLITGLMVMLGVATIVFAVVRMVPGDPVESILGEQALDLDKEALRSCLRLDQSLPQQYAAFLGDIMNGSLGYFCDNPDKAVVDEILRVLPATIELALCSLGLALLFSLPLGVLAAVHHRKGWDLAALIIALLGISMPNFWLGPMLLILFSVTLRWLPGPGAGYLGLTELILPAMTLATALMAKLTRMTRSSMIEVLHMDYIRSAKAKGLRDVIVYLKHALRNAMIPVISVAGVQLGALLAGAIIVEKVFARPGLGMLLLDAIQTRNYALVQGCVLFIAGFYVLANLLADLTYTWTDPRIRLGGGKR